MVGVVGGGLVFPSEIGVSSGQGVRRERVGLGIIEDTVVGVVGSIVAVAEDIEDLVLQVGCVRMVTTECQWQSKLSYLR